MKKSVKRAAGISAFILIGIILFFANGLLGNPISKMLANKSAKEYISENYSNMNLELEDAYYSFKSGDYYVQVKSPTSKDTHFAIGISLFGKVYYDTYEDDVKNRYNTYLRINEEYGDKVDKILDHTDILYKNDIYFGEIIDIRNLEAEEFNYNNLSYGINIQDLELDKDYDISKLGSEAGKIVFYASSDELSVEKASEILLYIKDIFDKEKLGFYAIDLAIDKTTGEEKVGLEEEIRINHFLYEDIYKEDLDSRVSEAIDYTKKYYEEQDRLKDEEIQKSIDKN